MPDPTDGPPPPPKPDDPDPDQPDPEEPDDDDGQCKQDGASSIACQTQKLRETVRLPGTPHSIHYASDRLAGRATGNTIELQLSTATPPPRVKRILLEVAVAGRTFTQVFPPAPNQLTTFTWMERTPSAARHRACNVYAQGSDTSTMLLTTTPAFGEFGSTNRRPNPGRVLD